MDIIAAIEGLIILIAFFYLVHLVSHIRNAARMQSYFNLIDRMNGEVLLSDTLFKNMRILGVLTKKQEKTLVERLGGKEQEEDDLLDRGAW